MRHRKNRMLRRRRAAFDRTARQIRALPTATTAQVPMGARVWGELRG